MLLTSPLFSANLRHSLHGTVHSYLCHSFGDTDASALMTLITRHGRQVVSSRSAKPVFVGANPTRASKTDFDINLNEEIKGWHKEL